MTPVATFDLVHYDRVHAFLFWATGRLLVGWGVIEDEDIDWKLMGSRVRSTSRIGVIVGDMLSERLTKNHNKHWNAIIAQHGVVEGSRMLLDHCVYTLDLLKILGDNDNDRALLVAVVMCATLYMEKPSDLRTAIDALAKRLVEKQIVEVSESIPHSLRKMPIKRQESSSPYPIIVATLVFIVGGLLYLRK